MIVTIQMLLGLAILGVGLQLLLGAVQLGLKRRSATATQDAGTPTDQQDASAD